MSNGPQHMTSESPSVSANAVSGHPAPANFVRRVLRFLWMSERIANAQAQCLGPSHQGWQEYSLAIDVRDAAEEIRESSKSHFTQLLLLKMQLALAIRCHLRRQELPLGSDILQVDWETARKVGLIDQLIQALPEKHWVQIKSLLSNGSDEHVANLGAEERAALVDPVRDLACGLMSPLEQEVGVVRRLRMLRYFNIALITIVVLFAAHATYDWLMDRAGKVNLAFGRPVTVSTQIPGAGTDHRALVDGDHTNLGFHTELKPNQYVVIDLGSSKKFDKVVVYNRADCCQERTVPLLLEVSDDNVHYRKLAERTDEFDVWTASMLRAKGRYVRLRLLSNNLFHLSEVEVY